MGNQEILEKAIQQAIDGGWDNNYWIKRFKLAKDLGEFEYLFNDETPSIESVIFNHDFAKALWGEVRHEDLGGRAKDGWQYHLQQMVIADDPIKYLGENI